VLEVGVFEMRKQQRGMTAIGLVALLAVFGLIAFGVIQLVPVYLENMKIVQLLKSVKSDLDGQNASLVQIKNSIGKRVDIEDLRDFDWKNEIEISSSGNGYYLVTEYSRQKSLIGNVYLLAEFYYEVEITK
jgi:hypothetical protein